MTKLTEQLDSHRRRYGITSKHYGQASLKGAYRQGSLLWDAAESSRVTITQSYGLAVNALSILAGMDPELQPHLSWMIGLGSVTGEIKTRQFMSMAECTEIDNHMKSVLYLLGERWITVEGLLIAEFFIRCYSAHVSLVNTFFYLSLPFHHTPLFVRVAQILDVPENSPLTFLNRVAQAGVPINHDNLVKRLAKIPTLILTTLDNLKTIVLTSPNNRLYTNLIHKLVNSKAFIINSEASVQLTATIIQSFLPITDLTLAAHSLAILLYNKSNSLFSFKFNKTLLGKLLENPSNPVTVLQLLHHQFVPLPQIFDSMHIVPTPTVGLSIILPVPQSLLQLVLQSAHSNLPQLHSSVQVIVGSLLLQTLETEPVDGIPMDIDAKSELRSFLECLFQEVPFRSQKIQNAVVMTVFEVMAHAVRFKGSRLVNLAEGKSILIYLHETAPFAFMNRIANLDEASDFSAWILTIFPKLDISFARKYCAPPTKRSASETMFRKIKGLLKFGVTNTFLADLFVQDYTVLELEHQIATLQDDELYSKLWLTILTPEQRAYVLAKFLDLNVRRNLGAAFDMTLAGALTSLGTQRDLFANLDNILKSRLLELAEISGTLPIYAQIILVGACPEANQSHALREINFGACITDEDNEFKIAQLALAIWLLAKTRQFSPELMATKGVMNFIETDLAHALLEVSRESPSAISVVTESLVPILVEAGHFMVPILLGKSMRDMIESNSAVAPMVFRVLEFLKDTECTATACNVVKAMEVYPQFAIDSAKIILASFRPDDSEYRRSIAALKASGAKSPEKCLPGDLVKKLKSGPKVAQLSKLIAEQFNSMDSLTFESVLASAPWIITFNDLLKTPISFILSHQSGPEDLLKAIVRHTNPADGIALLETIQMILPKLRNGVDQQSQELFYQFISDHKDNPDLLEAIMAALFDPSVNEATARSVFQLKSALALMEHLTATKTQPIRAWLTMRKDLAITTDFVRINLEGSHTNAMLQMMKILTPYQNETWVVEVSQILLEESFVSSIFAKAADTSIKLVSVITEILNCSNGSEAIISLFVDTTKWRIRPALKIIFDYVLEKSSKADVWLFLGAVFRLCSSQKARDVMFRNLVEVNINLLVTQEFLSTATTSSLIVCGSSIFGPYNDKEGKWNCLIETAVEKNVDSMLKTCLSKKSTEYAKQFAYLDLEQPDLPAIRINKEERTLDLEWDICIKNITVMLQNFVNVSESDEGKVYCLTKTIDAIFCHWAQFGKRMESEQSIIDERRLIEAIARFMNSRLDSLLIGQVVSSLNLSVWNSWVQCVASCALKQDEIEEIVAVAAVYIYEDACRNAEPMIQSARLGLSLILCRQTAALCVANVGTESDSVANFLYIQAFKIFTGLQTLRQRTSKIPFERPFSTMLRIWLKDVVLSNVLRSYGLISGVRGCDFRVKAQIVQFLLSVWPIELLVDPREEIDDFDFDKATVARVCELISDLMQEEEDPELRASYVNWATVLCVTAGGTPSSRLMSVQMWLPCLADSVKYCPAGSILASISLITSLPKISGIILPYTKKLGKPVVEAMKQPETDFYILSSCLLTLGKGLVEVRPESLDLICWESLHWGVKDMSISEFWNVVQHSAENCNEILPEVLEKVTEASRLKLLRRSPNSQAGLNPGKIYGVILERCCRASMSTDRLFRKFSVKLKEQLMTNDITTPELLHILGSFGTVLSLIDAASLKSILPSLTALVVMMFSYFTGSPGQQISDKMEEVWFGLFEGKDFAKCYSRTYLNEESLGFGTDDTEYAGVYVYTERKVNRDVVRDSRDVSFYEVENIFIGFASNVIRKCPASQAKELILGLLRAARNGSQSILANEEKGIEDLVNARLFYMCYLSIATKWGAVEFAGLEEDFISTFKAVKRHVKEHMGKSSTSSHKKRKISAGSEIEGTFWWYEVGVPAILSMAEAAGKGSWDSTLSNDLCKAILGLFDVVQYLPRFASLQSHADQYIADYYTRSWILALRKLTANSIGMLVSNTTAMSFTHSLFLEKISGSVDIRIKTSVVRGLVQAWKLNSDGLSVVLTDTLKTLVELMDDGDAELNALAKYWIHTIESRTGQSLAPRLAF